MVEPLRQSRPTVSLHVVCCSLQYKENMALRLKYSDQPDKFLDSEVDLDEHIQSLLQVRGQARTRQER